MPYLFEPLRWVRWLGLWAVVAAALGRGVSPALRGMASGEVVQVPRPPAGEALPYNQATDLAADLDILHRSLVSGRSAALARGRLRDLRRAVDVFGFHIATLDLRQNADVHERTIGELFEAAASGTNYKGLREEARVASLLAELGTSRPLMSPFITW